MDRGTPADLARLLDGARRAVALTGAGISVPSGIPDFRSAASGLWTKEDPMRVAHIDAFRRDPAGFWSFYGRRFAMLEGKSPNRAHAVLAELERTGRLRAVITQNVDGLHQRAGSREVIEVHGSLDEAACATCGERAARAEVARRIGAARDGIPRCAAGHPLRPGVVLFGELLPEAAVERAWALASETDLMLCVGSSLEVHPIAQLPQVALDAGARLAVVTRSPTPFDTRAAVRLDGDVEVELEAVLAASEALR